MTLRTGSAALAMGIEMHRDTTINVLLIIAGILLAFALFGAGFFFRGKISPKLLKCQLLFVGQIKGISQAC